MHCSYRLTCQIPIAVCRITVREMDKRIKKIDPTKMIEVSGFRMDSKDTKSIPFVKSEMFLTELMEEICKYNLQLEAPIRYSHHPRYHLNTLDIYR